VANASFRVYYSLGAGTVPFLWESKPGTPKSSVIPASGAASFVPPISPPPSYQSRSQTKANKFSKGKSSSSIWPAGGWISWLSQGIRRRSSPPSSPTDYQQRWLPQDHGVAGHERRPWRPTLCF
jgi:hypothetical protein